MLGSWRIILLGKLGMRRPLCFGRTYGLDDIMLARSFSRLFELAENKLVTVEDMFLSRWEVDGEAWK